MANSDDLRSIAFLDPILNYAEAQLGCRFKATGQYRYSSQCPFHDDTKESFRVYVDGSDVVRFHCFGKCDDDWDIYGVIQRKEECDTTQAQSIWADYLGIAAE